MARPGRIRGLGPLAVLAVPVGLVALAALILRLWPCEGTACGEPHAGSWLLVLIAFPTALAAGLPWIVSPLNLAAAVVTSVAGWIAFGVWAGRRATADVEATWWTFWREVAFVVGGVAGGVLVGLLAMLALLTLF